MAVAPPEEVRRFGQRSSDAEVLLYSLPTGRQWAATAYAKAALEAGVAFVNCTPELVARDPDLLDAYRRAGVPLIGDDLASHFGTSVVHRALLGLLSDRGLTLASSYQLNFGGNEDFRNLGEQGASKRQCGTVVARAQLCSPTSSSSCRALFQSCVRFPGRAGNSLAPRPPALWQARQPVDPGNDTNGVSSSVK